MASKYSYFFRVQNVPDPEFRKQLMDAAEAYMDAGFMRELTERMHGVNATLARLEHDQKMQAEYRHPTPGLRSYTACLTHLQRLTARIDKLRDEACFAAAQQVFLQTGKRLPPVEDMDKPASEQAAKVWQDFAQTAKRLQAGLEAKAAQQSAPATPGTDQDIAGVAQAETPRPITGKELKVYVSLLVKARVPEPVREQLKQQARQGKFSLPQLRKLVAELTISQAA